MFQSQTTTLKHSRYELYQFPVIWHNRNYNYILIDKENNEALSVDPSLAPPVNDYLKAKGLKLNTILLTHHHWDHTDGAQELINEHNCLVYGFEGDKHRLPKLTQALRDCDNFQCLGLDIQVLFTPGHTGGHICYYIPSLEILFSGDVIFSLGCGRLFEGTPEEAWSSMKKIMELPGTTLLCMAHEYTASNLAFAISLTPDSPELVKKKSQVAKLVHQKLPTIPTTLGEEKKINPFLNCDNENFLKEIDMQDCSPAEVFRKIRNLKDSF